MIAFLKNEYSFVLNLTDFELDCVLIEQNLTFTYSPFDHEIIIIDNNQTDNNSTNNDTTFSLDTYNGCIIYDSNGVNDTSCYQCSPYTRIITQDSENEFSQQCECLTRTEFIDMGDNNTYQIRIFNTQFKNVTLNSTTDNDNET